MRGDMEKISQWRRGGVLGVVVALAVAMAAQAAGVAHLTAPAKVEAHAHATVSAVFRVAIDPGFHIQSDHPKLDYLIPTTLQIEPAGGISLSKVAWPAAKDYKFSFSPDPLSVFEGSFAVPVTLATGAAGEHALHGSFRYQACNDQLCRPPVTVPFTLTVDVR